MNVSSHQILNAAEIASTYMIPLGCGIAIGQIMDDTRWIDNQGRIYLDSNRWLMNTLAFGILGLGAFQIAGSHLSDQNFANTIIRVAMLAVPILYSHLKRTQVLVSTSLEKSKMGRDYVRVTEPYLSGGLKTGGGQVISLKEDDTFLRVNLVKNSYGIESAYIPERIINKLDTSGPLRLMYKGYPIEVIPKNFKCTHIRICDSLVNVDPAGLLTQADGSKINTNPKERIVELEFGENAILKKGYLPERLIRNLTPYNPLELKYRGRSVLITMADNCVNEAAPKPNPPKFTVTEAKEVLIADGKPLEIEKPAKFKAKRAEFHHTPELVVMNQAVVKENKPSLVTPAVEARIPAEENNSLSRIRRAAMSVAKSLEQLSQSLPEHESNEYHAEREERVRAIINGPGSIDEKEARIKGLLKA